MSANIYTMRHGDSEHDSGTFDDKDVNLTDFGYYQAEMAANVISMLGIGLIVTSPRARTRQTTERVIEAAGLRVPVVYDERLAEQNWGPLAGQKKAAYFEALEATGAPMGLDIPIHPGAETEAQVARRVNNAAAHYASFSGGNVLFMTHGQPAKAPAGVHQGLTRAEFKEVEVPHASLAQFNVADPGIRTPLFVPPQRPRQL